MTDIDFNSSWISEITGTTGTTESKETESKSKAKVPKVKEIKVKVKINPPKKIRLPIEIKETDIVKESERDEFKSIFESLKPKKIIDKYEITEEIVRIDRKKLFNFEEKLVNTDFYQNLGITIGGFILLSFLI